MTTTSSPPPSRLSALIDFTIIVATLLISKALLLQIDALWNYAGPISLILTLGVLASRVRARAGSWSSMGLKRPRSFNFLPLWVIVAFVLTTAAGILADITTAQFLPPVDPALDALNARYEGRFDAIPGNLNQYLIWLALSWIVGGFAEEIIFRGALIHYVENLLKGLPGAVWIAILLQAFIFGQQHAYYQGISGWVATGVIAVVSGALFLVFKRNLWPLILSHGLANTLGLTMIYLNSGQG